MVFITSHQLSRLLLNFDFNNVSGLQLNPTLPTKSILYPIIFIIAHCRSCLRSYPANFSWKCCFRPLPPGCCAAPTRQCQTMFPRMHTLQSLLLSRLPRNLYPTSWDNHGTQINLVPRDPPYTTTAFTVMSSPAQPHAFNHSPLRRRLFLCLPDFAPLMSTLLRLLQWRPAQHLYLSQIANGDLAALNILSQQ